MPDPQDPRALLEQHLDWIRRKAAQLCRHDRLDADDTDDFTSVVLTRLVEDDYAVLRKFRGDSALTTFLTVVLSMLFRDFRVSRWGRWRPSAEARRQGPLAIKLETLVYRDGYSLAQAAELLRSRGEIHVSDRELADLLSVLPSGTRGRPTPAGDESLLAAPASGSADRQVIEAEKVAERVQVGRAVARAVEGLPPEDQVIVRMRFLEGISVADIARSLHLPQKPLYRRVERVLAQLRVALEAEGISADRVRELLTLEEEE